MLRRIIPWLVLLLSSGCGGPRPFVTLAGSFREEGSAARRLGRTMPREDGAFPGPYRAFVVQGAAAEAIDGTYRNVRQIEAAVRAVVRAQINAQCGLDVTPAAGYNEARSIEIEWESVLDTTSDQWQFPQGGCCNDDGSVASQCRDQSVIVAIFRTRVTAHLAQRGGFSANGQFVCMQGTTAQAPVSETGSTAPQEPTAATDPTSASDVGPSEPSSSEDDPTSPPARQPAETSMTPEALRASDQAEGRLTIDVRLTASN
ncbi:MAG: hypothetical protein K8H88_32545, partial [Sandaracinaceae bacterium]|nr:hypothetical protein [Sandaracinaceae bacterium]